MISVHGVYENGVVKLLDPIPSIHTAKVIVTVLDDVQRNGSLSPKAGQPAAWLGSLADHAVIVDDIVNNTGYRSCIDDRHCIA